jgi:hypothetical protein
VKLLLGGDPGQRALAAFSLGWEHALEASDKNWEAPLLACALEDPYAAVRFIAYQSLSRLPGFETFPYNFESPPEQRRAAKQKALEVWARGADTLPERQSTLIGPGGMLDTNTLSGLLDHRDNRPMHLRE